MLNSKQLDKCLDVLQELRDSAERHGILEKLLEVGYILKKERDVVLVEETQASRTVDPRLLMRDNIQLMQENAKLKSANQKLSEIVGVKIPCIQKMGEEITSRIGVLCKVTK